MSEVIISKINELYVRISAEKSTLYEMQEHFSYYVEGYKFMPKWKNGTWDGKVKLLNLQTKSIYSGLISDVIKFCKRYNYTYQVASDVTPVDHIPDLKQFIKVIPEICSLTPRDYQMDAFVGAIVENKSLILSPTGSGKSLIIYLIINFLLQFTEENILVVVPSTSLVEQLTSDFVKYDPSGTFGDICHKIYSGKTKDALTRVTITTWQSIFQLPIEWFQKYGAVIIDEAHQADSTSLKGILEKMPHVVYRTGLTGTLDGTKSHTLFMRGIFGKLIRTVTTRKLMDQGVLADLTVQMYKVKYSNEECKAARKFKYDDEVEFIINHEKRNGFLLDLCFSQTKNTLLLFNFVDGHGVKLFEDAKLRAEREGKQVLLIHGDTPVDEREKIRRHIEEYDNVIVFASYGVFSTGIDVKNLHVVIFGQPYKSRIRNLQSIGRGLRTSSGKDSAILVDICDDLTYNTKTNSDKHNISYMHAIERLKIYESEQFKYRIIDVQFE